MPNYGFPPNFPILSSVPNYNPYYGSMMSYSSQPPPYSSTPTGNENVLDVRAIEFPRVSTQVTLRRMSDANEATPNAEDSTSTRRKIHKWTTEQNLVLLSGWIKYGTNSIVGQNQKSKSYWGKIAEYCNKHFSFDPPRDGVSCKNHFNYMNQKLDKWISVYDNAKRMQQIRWSENDVLAKAHEIYSSGKNEHFNLMSEWFAVRDQQRYASQLGGSTGSGSSGCKRAHESDAVSDSNSVGFSVHPTGREVGKKKGKKKCRAAALEAANEEWSNFKQLKEQEFEQLEKIAKRQEETNKLMKEKTEAKKMKMFLKLNEKENLDDRSKELFEKLSHDLFGS